MSPWWHRHLSPSPSSAPATSPAASAATSASSHGGLLLLGLRFRGVVDQQSLQRKAVWKNVVSNVVAAYAEGLQLDRIPVFHCHLHGFQMSVHRDVHSGDRAVDLGAVLQFDGDRLVAQFHEESDEFHFDGVCWAVGFIFLFNSRLCRWEEMVRFFKIKQAAYDGYSENEVWWLLKKHFPEYFFYLDKRYSL